MLSLFKKRASNSSSSMPYSRGLRPLLLVDKLVAAQVIQCVEAPKTAKILKLKKAVPPTRAAIVPKRAPFVVSSHFSGHRPRVPASQQTRAIPRRSVAKTGAPRAVSHHTKVVLKANPTLSGIPKPSKVSRIRCSDPTIKSPKKPILRSRIPVFSRRSSPIAFTPVTAPTSLHPRATNSKIPVFTGRSPANVSAATGHITQPPALPQTTSSRIPRFKYTSSVSPKALPSSSSDDNSFILLTPCPSPTLVVEARQKALKVSAVKTSQCVKTVEKEEIKNMDLSAPSLATDTDKPASSDSLISTERDPKATSGSDATDASPVSSSGNSDSIRRIALADPDSLNPSASSMLIDHDATNAHPPSSPDHTDGVRCTSSADSSAEPSDDSSTKAPSDNSPTNADQLSRSGTADSIWGSASASPSISSAMKANGSGGIMGSFVDELKIRLSWTNKSTKPFITRLPSNKENNEEEPSELQQVLARRRQAIAGSSFKFPAQHSPPPQDTRRPLAPTGFVNGVFVGHHDIKEVPLHPVPTEDTVSSDSNTDCNAPGADLAVTELVTTPFGTRHVRRMVIPPLPQGARPSRDPRIVLELNFLRAKQKVGGIVEVDKAV